jgi:hypothetical protein
MPERQRFGCARGRAAIFAVDCGNGAFNDISFNVTGDFIRSS